MDLTKLKKDELFKICENNNLKNYKSMNKKDLISLINKVSDPRNKVSDSHELKIVKPIIKWVGGKTQILDKLITEFPTDINNYHEIFLGGGSVLLALLSYVKIGNIKIKGNIYAYDLNEPLINMYKNIQLKHNELYNELEKLIKDFNSCEDIRSGEQMDKAPLRGSPQAPNRKPKNIIEAKMSKENYYYWIRDKYNKLTITNKNNVIGSAMFIFLNKTCFRGVFRIGPNGFNVPYGHYNNPEIINKEHLNEIHELIKNVIFQCCDFNISLKLIKENDFVYLDPPYAPETTSSFVKYTENGFNLENHIKLFNLIHEIIEPNNTIGQMGESTQVPNKNIKILLSNSDVSLVRDNFTDNKYNINTILCKRTINSKNPQSKTNEVLIKNY